MQETQTGVRSLGQEDPLEKELATRPSILAWESHAQRSLAGHSPCGRKEPDTAEPTQTDRQVEHSVGATGSF